MNDYAQALLMILLTVVLYYFVKRLQQKYPNPFLNPALIASLRIILVLLIFGISYNGYMKGGSWINHTLNAMAVCLAYPLCKDREKIKDSVSIIFASVLTSVMLSFMLVFLMLKAPGYSKGVIVTLLPRPITAAAGIEVPHELGSTDMMTVLFTIITGLIGSILDSMLLRSGRSESPIAKGLTYGNTSHAFGIAKTLEVDIESGALSSIGVILAAATSPVLIPVLILLFYQFRYLK